jgi:hypothetical protein
MTSDESSAALETLGWSFHHVARMPECDPKLTQLWATGQATLPPSAGTLADSVGSVPCPSSGANDGRVR